MLDFLFLISAKPVVVTLATIGAILATFSTAIETFLTNKNSADKAGMPTMHNAAESTPDNGGKSNKNERHRPQTPFGRWLNRLGYGIMGVSILLFIIAGFIVDLRG